MKNEIILKRKRRKVWAPDWVFVKVCGHYYYQNKTKRYIYHAILDNDNVHISRELHNSNIPRVDATKKVGAVKLVMNNCEVLFY